MSLAERRKGKTGELEVAALIRDHGFRARRDGRLDTDLDTDLESTHVEIKRTERPRLDAYCQQAEHDAEKHGKRTWAIFWRSSRRPWVVILPAEEYLRLRVIEAERQG